MSATFMATVRVAAARAGAAAWGSMLGSPE